MPVNNPSASAGTVDSVARTAVDTRTITDVSAVSSAGVLAPSQITQVDASGGAKTMTLPTGAPKGTVITVEKADTSANVVTISGSIRGSASTLTLTLAKESIQFVADAAGSWHPSAGHKTLSSLDARTSQFADSFWIGANELASQSGTPTKSNSPGGFKYASWLLRHSNSDSLVAARFLPPWVASVWVDVYWSNNTSTGGTGAVRLQTSLQVVSNGQSLATTDVLNTVTATAAAQDVLTITRTNTTAVPVSGMTGLLVKRLGSDAADTLVDNIAILGVRLVVASTVPLA